MKKVWPVVALVCVLAACAGGRTESGPSEADTTVCAEDTLEYDSLYAQEAEVEELDLPEGRDEAFSDFFFTFLNNRRFQAERIKWPLPVIAGDSVVQTITRGRVFREDFCLPSHETYTLLLSSPEQMELMQNDLDLADARLQIIDLAHLQAKTYHFLRNDGRWQLTETRHEAVDGQLHDFLAFYHRFSTDSVFQEQHLAPALRYVMNDTEDEMESIEGTIEASQWAAFRPEMPCGAITNIDFGQHYAPGAPLYLLQCGFSNGWLEVFTFERGKNGWILTSYEN